MLRSAVPGRGTAADQFSIAAQRFRDVPCAASRALRKRSHGEHNRHDHRHEHDEVDERLEGFGLGAQRIGQARASRVRWGQDGLASRFH